MHGMPHRVNLAKLDSSPIQPAQHIATLAVQVVLPLLQVLRHVPPVDLEPMPTLHCKNVSTAQKARILA